MGKTLLRTALLASSLLVAVFVVGAFSSGTAHAQTGVTCVQNPFTGVVTCFQTVNPFTPAQTQSPVPGCTFDAFGDLLCANGASPFAPAQPLLVAQQQPVVFVQQPFFPFVLPPGCFFTIFGTIICI
ncbi:MAG TPA: hypothetical protein VKV26_03310 [Dehalococcoidia bacterium]|nr:hypothetical protein [Dehalococcoidia bacterium]